MKRREFITLIGGAAVGWSHAARGQQPKAPTVGVLVVGSPGSEQFWRLFRNGMRELGYIEGQNIRYEFRSDEGKINRLPELAAELVGLKVDIIVTWFTPAARAAKQATREIPIVMALAGNPVENGLVESLDRPGGNVTGMSGVAAELASKSVELIQELLPSARHVAALANAPDPFSGPFLEQIRLGGQAIGVTIDAVMIRSADELEKAFPAMEQKRPDAIIVQPSLPAKRVAELALRYRIPSVGIIRVFVEEGGLMTYSFPLADMYRRAAIYVDKILKGAKPADLPVEQPTKFELVINLKTAKALGLSVPPSLLGRADQVIE
ncbi:MAG TPA: ABC transporter substrate-binding protein [Pseudolabrys sp.]|jgi:putative ABC transport system substrate-binding protein|nr:ABC transporter substrate-binding protein [Pseudolabrys sp.]